MDADTGRVLVERNGKFKTKLKIDCALLATHGKNVEDGIYLDKTDILYVLPEQSLSGANAIWLASPFYPNSGTVMYVHYGR